MLELYKNSVLQDTVYGSAYKTVRLIEKHFEGIQILHTNKITSAMDSGVAFKPLGNSKQERDQLEGNPIINNISKPTVSHDYLSTSFDPRESPTVSVTCPTCGANREFLTSMDADMDAQLRVDPDSPNKEFSVPIKPDVNNIDEHVAKLSLKDDPKTDVDSFKSKGSYKIKRIYNP